jgi:hypothetical protein
MGWALFVPVADWLAHHDVGSVSGPLHETAVDNARGRVLTYSAGLFAAGALIFTAQNFILSRRTFELTQQGQVADRYTKAIEQLGSTELGVRIGGIYALERVARDSVRDHPTVMEVLSAFIREHSRERWPLEDSGDLRQRSTRPDAQAAITVVARRDPRRDIPPIDLVGAELSRANLSHANLAYVDLHFANLTSADLSRADLTRATVFRSNLTDAGLDWANLASASFIRTKFTAACLSGANLTGANLNQADLTDANLTGAHLSGADLTGANLDYAV